MMFCVNQNCGAPMGSLVDGRLFHFEILSICVSANDELKKDGDEIPNRNTMQFWLCGQCAETMTVAMKPIGGLHLLPLERDREPPIELSERFHELQETLQHS